MWFLLELNYSVLLRSQLDPSHVASHFLLDSRIHSAEQVAAGHINDSYRVLTEDGGQYLLQRINTAIFRDPVRLMENIERVLDHLSAKCESERERRVLRLIPTAAGGFCYEREDTFWRMYWFIDGTYIHRAVEGPHEARTAGAAFGRFQAMLADLPPHLLNETIPGFHDTPSRFQLFEEAVAGDAFRRASECAPEISFAMSRQPLAEWLVNAGPPLPVRIAHNDAKISNILFDSETHEALCVVDLDTVMPGTSLYDVGDMMRSMTTGRDEDERDLSLVNVRLDLFKALAEGYLSQMADRLLTSERELLVSSGMVITYEQGIRFLTDYLNGDVYYRQAFPAQNLQRTRAQFALLKSMEDHCAEMESLVASI